MTAPGYFWACQKCGKENAPGTEVCKDCGFTATYKVSQLPIKTKEDGAEEIDRKETDFEKNILLFFPEIIPAISFLISAPFSIIKFIINGEFLSGLLLIFANVICAASFYFSCKHNNKYVAYFVMVIYLLLVSLIFSR